MPCQWWQRSAKPPVVKTLRALRSLGGAQGAWRRWSTMKRRCRISDGWPRKQGLQHRGSRRSPDAEYRVTITAAEGAELPKGRRLPALPRRAEKDRRHHLGRPHGRGTRKLGKLCSKRFLFSAHAAGDAARGDLFYNAGAASPVKARPRSKGICRRCRAGASGI